VLMPFGGKYQRTPIQAMVNKVSVEKKHTDTCSFMSWGFNPFVSEKSPYHGAYLAVVESLAKLVATGGSMDGAYLTFQEYFESPRTDGKRWGKPLSALLGAFDAQLDFEIASIGGKDSMSGSFEDIDVPPTLVSFAVTTGKVQNVVSPEFKKAGSKVVLVAPEYNKYGLPDKDSQKAVFAQIEKLIKEGKVLAAYTPGFGGVAEAVYKMAIGNGIGFEFCEGTDEKAVFDCSYGSFILELSCDENIGTLLGYTTEKAEITLSGEAVAIDGLSDLYEGKLEDVFSCNIDQGNREIPTLNFESNKVITPAIKVAKPKVLIPVFPGTNCEFDSAKVMRDAGAEAEIIVIKNLSPAAVTESVEYFANQLKSAQMVFIPGGFSGGDEPDGSGKFITAFFRNKAVTEQVHELLKNRDGLMCGICNGFQALIKLGLVPFGEIVDTDENCPTLTYNTIGRHQSKLVNVRVASNLSPWLKNSKVGDTYLTAISHGEGRFLASEDVIKKLIENGQVATQYVDLDGNATADIQFNPNNSAYAIEGITSPDGRVFGKMGHCERVGNGLYKNVPGNSDMGIFRAAVEYFK
ncbi:MAG: phosphoribosylformylglycinamidine synthase subunit PurQ, partial [Ruminococcus sp.]|nr:phosphoribosylformylglycinamidine synthase subunit PurQ [Ruminococcus sp.]